MDDNALKRVDEPSDDAKFLSVGDLAHAQNESGQLLTLLVLGLLSDNRYHVRIIGVTSQHNQRVSFIGDEIDVDWDCLFSLRKQTRNTT